MKVIQFPEIDYWGGCPKCGKNDGYLNAGREHWFICHRHRVKWLVGTNLFSSWQEEDESTWRRNGQVLAGYREVRPVDPGPVYSS